MKKVILYIAQSLDGFISRKNGDLDWLENDNDGLDFGYDSFLSEIDTVVMGGNTYRQVLTFGEYPYLDKMNIIITRNPDQTEKPNFKFICENIINQIQEEINKTGKNIWLVGGSEINTIFLENDMIDEIDLFIKSVAIGEGIPLFKSNTSFEKKFKLISSQQYKDKFIRLKYQKIQ